jgi:hypothetical protein
MKSLRRLLIAISERVTNEPSKHKASEAAQMDPADIAKIAGELFTVTSGIAGAVEYLFLRKYSVERAIRDLKFVSLFQDYRSMQGGSCLIQNLSEIQRRIEQRRRPPRKVGVLESGFMYCLSCLPTLAICAIIMLPPLGPKDAEIAALLCASSLILNLALLLLAKRWRSASGQWLLVIPLGLLTDFICLSIIVFILAPAT